MGRVPVLKHPPAVLIWDQSTPSYAAYGPGTQLLGQFIQADPRSVVGLAPKRGHFTLINRVKTQIKIPLLHNGMVQLGPLNCTNLCFGVWHIDITCIITNMRLNSAGRTRWAFQESRSKTKQAGIETIWSMAGVKGGQVILCTGQTGVTEWQDSKCKTEEADVVLLSAWVCLVG